MTRVQVNALKIEQIGCELVVTVGASNHQTQEWVIGMAQAAALVVGIRAAMPKEVAFD